ncbi:unnamed protein product [Clonostachys rhizophaga]|uniref:UbiA prenyltransferase n=1 Tax=Clonostachys rhizophaga TaxID=160324 RepID=A0A9N9V8X8_9HYPO|nr:unnamed protein product [Clonostachys rhizophaga]
MSVETSLARHEPKSQASSLISGQKTKSRGLGFHLWTLFLFTKSDFKTMTIPQSIFAIAAVYAPPAVKCVRSFDSSTPPDLGYLLTHIPRMLFWLWLNCALHDIANQSLPDSVVEDAVNKPWRPIPSGRISRSQARSWLLAIIPLSLAVSLMFGALVPVTMLVVFVWMYNDLEGSSASIWMRNALNGTGLMSFGCGALTVLAGGEGSLLPKAYNWLFLTGLIVSTTVQSQDLPDLEGDRARGRQTIPIVYGESVARWSVASMVLLWSILGPWFWATETTSIYFWAPSIVLGVALASLALVRWGQKWDEVVLQLWCLWLLIIYLSPALASWV